MQVKEIDGGFLLRLAIGEEVIETLTRFVRSRQIRSGWFTGLGAVKETELGSYDLKRRKYVRRRFKTDHELVTLAGNIAWLNKDPVLHAHAVIADEKLRAYGGHFFRGLTAVTVEVVLQPSSTRVRRGPDPATGLNLLALGSSSPGRRSRP
jgi:hypothetical protein